MTLTKGKEENAGRRETHPHQGPPPQSGVRENKFFAKLSYKKAGERKSEVKNAGRRETHPHQGPPPQSGAGESKFFAKLSYKKAGEREE